MSDVTLNDITSGYNLSKINDNFDKLENAVNNEILHTTGGNNTMSQQLDMNNKRIINLPAPSNPTDPVRLQEYQQWVDTLTGVEGVVPIIQDRQYGDGSTLIFNAPHTVASGPQSFFVHIDGVAQRPVTDYDSATLGKINFYEAPYDGAIVDITYFEPQVTTDPDVQDTIDIVDNIQDNTDANNGASLVGYYDWAAPAYLKTISDIANGIEISITRFISPSYHSGIRAGTNAHDLSTSWQDAFDSGAYSLWIPAGSYNIESALSINSNGVRIRAAGPERAKLIQNTADISAIESNTSITRLLWCSIDGLRVEMPGGSAGHGIHIRNPEVFKAQFVRVTTLSGTKTTGNGIYIEKESASDYGYYTEIQHSHIDKCGNGVVVEGQNPGGANAHWMRSVVSNDNTNYGFYAKNNSGLYLQSCAAEINNHNLYIEGGFDVQAEACRFERANTHNVYLHSGDAHLIKSCLLASAGYVATSTGRGVYMASGQFSRVEGNVFQEGFSSYDVEVVSGYNNAVLLDNICKSIANGWNAGGLRVSDSGNNTIRRELVNTASNTYIGHKSNVRYDTGIMAIGSAQARIYSGTGSPEGVVTAYRGSVHLRVDGGGGFTFYVKETGDGTNTGWVAK